MPAINDVYYIEERIQEVYPDLFLTGSPGGYLVKDRKPVLVRGSGFAYAVDRERILMPWPQMTLDARLLHQLRYADSWNGQRDILRELEEDDDRRERAKQRRIDEMAETAAKEMRVALAHDFGWR